jgi:hypothetical protein
LQLNAEALTKLIGVGFPMHAEQFNFAGIRSGETFADFDGCGFASAIGAEEAKAFASANFEVEAVDGDNFLISLAKTSDAKGWCGSDRGHGSSIASGKWRCNLRCAVCGIHVVGGVSFLRHGTMTTVNLERELVSAFFAGAVAPL